MSNKHVEHKYVYYFGGNKADGTRYMKEILGGKGANLAEMVNLHMPVPPGFTVTPEVCAIYEKTKGDYPQELRDQILKSLARVEAEMGRKFGDAANPLLFSVRSGAAMSMPGMMDTVLNLGLNDETTRNIAARSPTAFRFAYDSYRRFITMYSDVVMQIGREDFEHEIGHLKDRLKVKTDSEIPGSDLAALCEVYKAIYKRKTNTDFPQDPMTQMFSAINAVFRSWGNPRAVAYRRIYHIRGLLGTAVNIQAMVFGNLNERSATGVAFSRNPSTGENKFYGEYLVNAQGEDVVAGIRTPQQVSKEGSLTWAAGHRVAEDVRATKFPSMEESMPENYKTLVSIKDKLELHFKDMQDIEFTVEDGRLWMLQCRNAKRTMQASVKCAVDMLAEGLIDEEEAVMRIDPEQVDHLLHPSLDPNANPKSIGKGLPASPGAAVGQIVFDAETAQAWAAQGKKVILVRLETSPEDLSGMHVAQGILTARGGMTSHAAVVARGMGKTCVAGCADLVFKGKEVKIGPVVYKEGDYITLDGTKGRIYAGQVPLVQPSMRGDFEKIILLCKKYKRLGVRANADTPKDAQTAFTFGAEGVGLCRTEHMFFEGNRIDVMREMILSTAKMDEALAKILPLQRGDFLGIFQAMKGQACCIRLLDPPLHEFLPPDEASQRDLATKMNVPYDQVAKRVKDLHEQNPMLGHRGVRLGISYPAMYNMQVQAIMEAAVEAKKQGLTVVPEIMIPLVGKVEELIYAKENCIRTAEAVLKTAGVVISYSIGTMIEVPRAALTADKIGAEAEFFSFGTNDLTQMGCGFSRDDSGSFLGKYLELGIYNKDPFQSIDQEGVGELIRIAIRKGRSVNPTLKIGICGEHGGDPDSITFSHNVGLNYVSCSPFRVPVAIVSAARASIKEKRSLAEARKKLAFASKL